MTPLMGGRKHNDGSLVFPTSYIRTPEHSNDVIPFIIYACFLVWRVQTDRLPAPHMVQTFVRKGPRFRAATNRFESSILKLAVFFLWASRTVLLTTKQARWLIFTLLNSIKTSVCHLRRVAIFKLVLNLKKNKNAEGNIEEGLQFINARNTKKIFNMSCYQK